MRLKCDGTRAVTRFRLSPKRTSPFKSAGASVQSTADSRGVRISGSNAGYTTIRGSVKGTGYPLDSPVSPSLPLPCITVCHQVSNALYNTVQKVCCVLTNSYILVFCIKAIEHNWDIASKSYEVSKTKINQQNAQINSGLIYY